MITRIVKLIIDREKADEFQLFLKKIDPILVILRDVVMLNY